MINDRRIVIFGAQSRAKTLKGYVQFLYPDVEIVAFLVDAGEENVSLIDGIPVLLLPDATIPRDVPVYIATKAIYHEDIANRLRKKGVKKIVPVTVEVDNFFRNKYVEKVYENRLREFVKIDTLDIMRRIERSRDIRGVVYMAKSIYDKPLVYSKVPEQYIVPIQVGAALTQQRLEDCKITDNTVIGERKDNISEMNRQYSELTALYWMWKNAGEDVIGLCHYRRHFVLPPDWAEIMQAKAIDVILPVPTYVEPSIAENYRERHDATDWDFLMEYLREKYPEDYVVAERVFAGNLYSPCNMLIARREVLDTLCAWMFPILFAVQEHGGEKEDVYQNRYLGFVSERLITLFFEKHYEEYNIVYADKEFIS